jgi:antitoxin (DNA-binding transcriptional repressor) of toxin-antitoxin stability system
MPKRPVTYRDLRNTPGRVFERLAEGEPLPLVADGTTRALLIPVQDGDVDTALDAWRRGRALLALARLQAEARRTGTVVLTAREIAGEVRAARRGRRARETDR